MATGMNGVDLKMLDYILETKTEEQILFINHAASVNYERSEEKRRRERFCVYCGAPEVSEDIMGDRVCGKCKQAQPGKQRKSSADVIKIGNLTFVGDNEMSSVEKLKMYCKRNKRPELYEQFVLNNKF